jgi:hypothetical protein
MATTVRQIITDALEQIGAIDGGASPTAQQANQALRVFQNLILNLPGSHWWNEVETSASYTAGENERIRVITQSAVTITVPVAVSSARSVLYCCNQIELTCEGYDDRAPKDLTRVHVSDAYGDTSATYYYRSDIAQWTRADSLTLDSDSPLGAEWDEGLGAMLGARMCRYYGLPLDQGTVTIASQTESRMRSRFAKRQSVAVDSALLRTSSNEVWSEH